MDRRSRRSRLSSEQKTPTSAGRGRPRLDKTPIKTESPSKASSSTATLTPSTPTEPGTTPEVVLNARGMPARQRKKNRYYYDEDTMITPDTMARAKAANKRIKPEPIEVEELAEVDMFPFTTSPARHYEKPAENEEHSVPSPQLSRVKYFPPSTNDEAAPKRGKKSVGKLTPQKDYIEKPKRRRSPARLPCDTIPAAAATKGVRGRGKKFLDEEARKEKVDVRKKLKTVTTPVSEPEAVKKPKMQFIRIKRELDMSLGAPEHVIQPEYETTYRHNRERRQSERDRREQQENRKLTSRIDERMIKRDYSEPIAHSSTSMQSNYVHDGDYIGQSLKLHTSVPGLAPIERGGLDKKTAHDISIRLRNLLKLPKAHKWVCYEWFYSNIDKVLFEGENDFQICLKESFPQLKVRKMARVEWCKVRRLMGKPRRCSQSFFDEEREELMRRRQKIRMIQQRKMTDFNYKELPDEIPLQLVIGTKVTSRLRKPQDGLFTGTIDGVDTSNNTYRITFDRPGLGTHSIPDYEVLSNEPPETVSTSSFAMKIPRRNYGPFSSGTFKFQNPLLMGEEIPGFPKSPFPVDGMLGGFPIRLLDMIVRLSKLLKGKREKILQLKELNVEAEKLRSYGKRFNDDYRLRYARVVVDLGSMNKEMNMYLDGIQQYCLEIAPDHGSFQMVIPEHVQESCRQEAILLVDTYNTNKNRNMVHGNKSLQLIADMASLLLQVKTLSTGDRNSYELKSIKDTVTEIKASLGGKNLQIFQDRVEIPMNRIQAGLTLPHK